MTMSLEVDDLDGLPRLTGVLIFCRSASTQIWSKYSLTLNCVVQFWPRDLTSGTDVLDSRLSSVQPDTCGYGKHSQ